MLRLDKRKELITNLLFGRRAYSTSGQGISQRVKNHLALPPLFVALGHPRGLLQLSRDGDDGDWSVALAKAVRIVGYALLQTPLAPRKALTPALVKAGIARQTHAGRLVNLVAILSANRASRKVAPASALLTRMYVSTATRLLNTIHHDGIVASSAMDTRLRRTECRGVERGLHKPGDLAR
jgi:hypothetical protein